METVFDPDRPYFSAWVKLYNIDRRIGSSGLKSKVRPDPAPLYHAAFCGFHEIVEHLALKHPDYANAISGPRGTALHSASDAGHIEVVRSLLKCGVDVDSLGSLGRSPLQLASRNGCLDVVQCLLDHGADAKFQDGDYITPLSHAAVYGHLEIVRILLEHNAIIDTPSRQLGCTPLHWVIINDFYNSKGNHPLEPGIDL